MVILPAGFLPLKPKAGDGGQPPDVSRNGYAKNPIRVGLYA
jgi:hypothetical protein